MMQYRVIYYNRSTGRVGGLINVPGNLLPQVLTLAGIQNANDLGEYPLNSTQVRDIAMLMKFKIDLSRFTYNLEPMGQIPLIA
jgi:hypothetical protein